MKRTVKFGLFLFATALSLFIAARLYQSNSAWVRPVAIALLVMVFAFGYILVRSRPKTTEEVRAPAVPQGYLFWSLVFLGSLSLVLSGQALYSMLTEKDQSYQVVGFGIHFGVAVILLAVAARVHRRMKAR